MLNVAKAHQDERIIVATEREDNVAIEVKYHRSCWKGYTSKKTLGQIAKDTGKNYGIYDVAFESIEKIVEESMMQNGDILRMSQLTQIFNESLEETGEADVNYRNQKLKNRLIKRFGSRIGFWHPRNRWGSEIAFCNVVQKR